MRNRNTMGRGEFIGQNIYWGLIVMVMYRNILFRVYPGMSPGSSRLLLWGLTAAGIALGTILTFKRRRNDLSVAVNVLAPYELYGFLTYRNTLGSTMLWVFGISLGLSVLYFLFVMVVSGADRKNRYPFLPCLRHSLLGARTVLVGAFALCWLPVLVGAVLGRPLFPAGVAAVSSREGAPMTISANMEVVRNLEEEVWNGLDLQSRLDTLQTIANIECSRLGLPEELPLAADPLAESIAANYCDNTRQISVSLDRLERDAPRELLDSVCHEAYHAYQHRLCEVWNALDEEYRNLSCFADVEDYIREFAGYHVLSRDFDSYYSMACETNARQYAAAAVEEYYRWLEIYRNQGVGEPA